MIRRMQEEVSDQRDPQRDIFVRYGPLLLLTPHGNKGGRGGNLSDTKVFHCVFLAAFPPLSDPPIRLEGMAEQLTRIFSPVCYFSPWCRGHPCMSGCAGPPCVTSWMKSRPRLGRTVPTDCPFRLKHTHPRKSVNCRRRSAARDLKAPAGLDCWRAEQDAASCGPRPLPAAVCGAGTPSPVPSGAAR